MSILQPISNLALRKDRSTGPASVSANDTVLRATGVVSLLAIGAIHFLQIVPTTEATPLLGVSFLFLIVAAVVVAARLATHSDRRSWIASAAVCAAAIGGYVFTRTFSTPLDNQDAGNWSCMLGLAALFVETTLLAFSAYAALSTRALQTAIRPARTSAGVSPHRAGKLERGMRIRANAPEANDGVDRRLAGRHKIGNWHQHRSNPAKPGAPRDPVPPPAPPRAPQWRIWLVVAGAVLTFSLFARPAMTKGAPPQNFSFTDFVTHVDANQVKTATVDPNGHVIGILLNGAHYTSQVPTAIPDTQLATQLQDHKVQVIGTTGGGVSALGVIFNLLPLLLFVGFFVWMGRRGRAIAGGITVVGRSKARVYDLDDRPSTRFGDVAGYAGAKQEVTEVVDFLKHPDKYRHAGAVGPRGVLMVGPPGTGKTLMARAVAGEAGVPFLALTGSSFVEMFVGVGAARVRDLFADARKKAPAIIFIDEIDAIGGRRGSGHFGGNDEREQTLNQLLAEMDGFDPATGVVLIAATNRPESLDPALLRPGRFDRTVEIPLPNQAERRAILAVHTPGKHLAGDVDLDVVARGTPGFAGADLANLVNEAAIVAVRHDRATLTAADFDTARDRILLGRRDASNALMPEEKHAVAVHESGHSLVAALSPHADPVAKVTILPAGQALGVTEQLPISERHLYQESYLYDSLAVRLGGRAAEILVLGESSTGAANDLAGATQLATRMVRDWGMSPRLGPIGLTADGPNYLGLENAGPRTYAEETQRVIDEEVSRLLRQAQQRATDLLATHRAALDQLIDLLQEKETIDGTEIDTIINTLRQRLTPVAGPTDLAADEAVEPVNGFDVKLAG